MELLKLASRLMSSSVLENMGRTQLCMHRLAAQELPPGGRAVQPIWLIGMDFVLWAI